MALDMANGGVSFAAVRGLVSFYLVAPTILLVLAARTSAIHKQKFNVPRSGGEHNDLFNFVKLLNCKNLHRAEQKSLGVKASNRPISSVTSYHVTLRTGGQLGFCALCFYFPTKMLHLNAPFLGVDTRSVETTFGMG